MAAGDRVTWQWRGDDGLWESYQPHVSKYIESFNKANAQTVCLGNADSSFKMYTINLAQKMQTNTSTGNSRPVQRLVKADKSSPAQGVSWQWRDDQGTGWNPYTRSVGQYLEQQYNSGVQSVNLSHTQFGMPYTINFQQMVQTRNNTGTLRPVRRQTHQKSQHFQSDQPCIGTKKDQKVATASSFSFDLRKLLENTEDSFKPPQDDNIFDDWKSLAGLQGGNICLSSKGITNIEQLLQYLGNPKELSVPDVEGQRSRSIYFYYNPTIEQGFSDKRRSYFQEFGNSSEEVWAFHGTSKQNAESILRQNFDLNKLQRMAYGKGTYFTSYYQTSLQYGQYILLCKLLVGFPTVHSGNDTTDYHTKLVSPQEVHHANMFVVSHPSQILPVFLLHPGK